MSGRPVIVVGAGGHGAVVADALLAGGRTVLGFVDADPGAASGLPGLDVLGSDESLDPNAGYDLANGIGGTGAGGTAGLRRRVQERLEARGFRFTGVRHPSAVVSSHVAVADDVQLLARSVIQTGARIGTGAIINTGVIIEHGCRVGAFTHCASGAILCGDVEIGEGSHIGAGAVIRQGVRLEPGVVVGAGAVVLDAGSGVGMLIGVPARRRGPV
ncbi:MAG: NeuD/PglB/VioB family sugar acetyltransferase [Alphaproteobacteria bacterium]|nr:NeuD/PglB/VioB family sugar acetyltransferase [Alphaproteobacteria bacterium]MBU2270039.1 NeuD/PglB/VioB family sugar acetyltransferase [Alphaproteobacteria bacterium]MBU2417882.1 NeuD/PglB/VioB family sugar acetyltransferase [Alphaproteobacteria bacterium]